MVLTAGVPRVCASSIGLIFQLTGAFQLAGAQPPACLPSRIPAVTWHPESVARPRLSGPEASWLGTSLPTTRSRTRPATRSTLRRSDRS